MHRDQRRFEPPESKQERRVDLEEPGGPPGREETVGPDAKALASPRYRRGEGAGEPQHEDEQVLEWSDEEPKPQPLLEAAQYHGVRCKLECDARAGGCRRKRHGDEKKRNRVEQRFAGVG